MSRFMSVTSCESKENRQKILLIYFHQLTDLDIIGIPSRVVEPIPSTFFPTVVWVDVIFLDSSILLSLASLLKSRFME